MDDKDKTLNGIIKISKLIEIIKKDGYIDCNRDDPYDGNMYESILYYLKTCEGLFICQNLDKIYDVIENEKEKNNGVS